MALPFSRNTTYAAGSQVKSADLNAIQDAFVAHHSRPLHFGAYVWEGDNIDRSTYPNQIVQAAAGAFTAFADITSDLIPGDTIKEVTWRWLNGTTPAAGAIDVEISIYDMVAHTSGFVAGSQLTLDGTTGGASAIRNSTDAINHVVQANKVYILKFACAAAPANDGVRLRGATVVLGT